MISLRFIADMGVSLRTNGWLKENGYDSVHVREQNFHRKSDEEIIVKAGGEQGNINF